MAKREIKLNLPGEKRLAKAYKEWMDAEKKLDKIHEQIYKLERERGYLINDLERAKLEYDNALLGRKKGYVPPLKDIL